MMPLNSDIVNAIPSEFSRRAVAHFAKALRKHPRFAYALFENDVPDDAEYRLKCARNKVSYYERCGWLAGTILAECEITEANVAHLKGDAAACVDELYDAVAVLMRMIAVVEGRQKLGGEK
jgi:hypothetical protein